MESFFFSVHLNKTPHQKYELSDPNHVLNKLSFVPQDMVKMNMRFKQSTQQRFTHKVGEKRIFSVDASHAHNCQKII
jgi:hypothetical protein